MCALMILSGSPLGFLPLFVHIYFIPMECHGMCHTPNIRFCGRKRGPFLVFSNKAPASHFRRSFVQFHSLPDARKPGATAAMGRRRAPDGPDPPYARVADVTASPRSHHITGHGRVTRPQEV